ncbi:MAG: hypothetical protein ACXU8R_06265 [Xanthobacteraceae bacterium]
MESLAQRLYAVTQLQEVELTGPGIMGVIGAMNERYAKRLGFDPGTIEKAHRADICDARLLIIASRSTR